MTTTQEASAEPRHPFTKTGFIISMVAMVILVMALIFVIINGVTRDRSPQVGPAIAQSCELPASERTSIIGAPEAGWIALSPSVSIPQHPEYGPSSTAGAMHSCYAQAPEGAVFAAMNMVALDITGRSHDLYTNLTVEGPERNTLLEGTPTTRAHSQGNPRLIGFNLVDYRTSSAMVEVIIRDDTTTAGITIPVVWEGSDWKFDPPTSLEPVVRAIGGNDTYTALAEGE